jgi:hypothetical protein
MRITKVNRVGGKGYWLSRYNVRILFQTGYGKSKEASYESCDLSYHSNARGNSNQGFNKQCKQHKSNGRILKDKARPGVFDPVVQLILEKLNLHKAD